MPYNTTWTLEMWKHEVAHNQTLLGYFAWVGYMKSRVGEEK